MAPVGNIATFHGIPNTTGLNLPALFEMPKLTATVPLTPSQPITSFPSMDIPQSSNQPASNSAAAAAFLPTNLLMSCNLSFLTPQQLAFYALQMQNHQNQQQQQRSPPANMLNPLNVNMVAQFMPAFVQQPFLGNLSLMGALPTIQTPTANAQMFQAHQMAISKPDQTPPSTSFLHSSPATFFNNNNPLPPPTSSNLSPLNSTPTFNLNQQQNIVPTNTFTLIGSSVPSTVETQKKEEQQQHKLSTQFTSDQQQQQVSPPILRPDSPELSDPNLPPMLQPELPCLNEFTDSDDFSNPPELLLSDRFMFDDESGPPRLEPQVPISSNLECEQIEILQKFANSIAPISPPSTILSPSKTVNNNNNNNEKEHPLLARQPLLTAMLLNAKQLSSPKLEIQPRTVSVESDQTNRKRERSASTDSSDLMFKMPKLVPMIEEDQFVEEEAEKDEPLLEKQDDLVKNEDEDTFESTTPPVLDSTVDNEEVELIEEDENEKEPKEEEIVEKEEAKVEEIKKIEEVVEEKSEEPELAVSVETHDHNVSIASSSGVSSANSSLVSNEEPIIIRFKRPIETKPTQEQEPEKTSCHFKYEDLPAPLTPVQNLRPRHQKPSAKKTQAKKVVQTKKGRPSSKFSTQLRKTTPKQKLTAIKRKCIKIQSDWQPMDCGHIVDFRLNHELQSQKRRCYNSIQHCREREEIIRVRDCIKVRSSEGLENIGKVVRLFLDESNGTICVQVLWYYTQAQIESRDIILHEKELLASKHCDVINADAIEEHAFVLTYSEYCRFVAETRLDELPPSQRPLESAELYSRGDPNYQRRIRLPHEDSPIDLVYWCQRTFSIKTRKICVSAMSNNSRRGSKNGRKR